NSSTSTLKPTHSSIWAEVVGTASSGGASTMPQRSPSAACRPARASATREENSSSVSVEVVVDESSGASGALVLDVVRSASPASSSPQATNVNSAGTRSSTAQVRVILMWGLAELGGQGRRGYGTSPGAPPRPGPVRNSTATRLPFQT